MASSGSGSRKLGRPSKGDRVGTHVALPADFRAAVELIAERESIPMGDVITRFVAQGLGKPAPDYCKPAPANQEELPLHRGSGVEESLQRSA